VSAAFQPLNEEAELHAPQLRLVLEIMDLKLRRGGGGRRDRCTYAFGVTTLLAHGLVSSIFGIGIFCWLIFALAVYALPFFVALSIGITAFQSGAGLIGALLIATAGGSLTLALGQVTFAGMA
jgi:hypothetical protein